VSISEKIGKIGYYLVKIWTMTKCDSFLRQSTPSGFFNSPTFLTHFNLCYLKWSQKPKVNFVNCYGK